MARGPDQIIDAAARSMGLRPGTQWFSPFPFAGMNTRASPVAIDDHEFPYIENFLRLGDGKLRTAWAEGDPFYTPPRSRKIVCFFPYTRGVNYFFAVFLDDGSAVEVSWPSGAVREIGGTGLFFSAGSGQLPYCVQFGVIYLIISNRNSPNDYWIWDGKLLYKTGTAAPNGVNIMSAGSNYNTPPTTTVYGGLGSGIVLQPVINNGGVVELNILDPGSGYEVGDYLQVAFAGGGSDTSAILTADVNTTGVASANITNPGSGYTSATVAFSGGGGSGAAATAVVGAGVSSVAVNNPGSGYSGANVSFTGGGGSGAAASAVVNGGEVIEIVVSDPGSGYTAAPGVSITGDGSGATAVATVNSGEVVSIVITSPGTGYVAAPAIAISGDGTGATAVAVLRSGSVQSVTVTNKGSGFFQPPLISFIGGGAPTAIATGAVFVKGTSVAKINLLAGGKGYGNVDGIGPNVKVLGGKATHVALATDQIADGSVINITVTNGGAGYQLLPLISFVNFGKDTGSGAVGQAVLAPTAIDHVVLANYGENYTSAPAVQIAPGSNNSAYANITLMPFGLSGSAMETFQNRVWIADPAQEEFSTLPPQGDFSVTAPGSVTDVATSAGGLIFTNSDRFLQTKYVALRQSNGYLYFMGDGSVSVASNVQTSTDQTSGAVTTTFSYQNVDPQVGAAWRDSLQDYGKTILFGNETGVFGLYGGAATKVSEKLDDTFLEALFPPTAGAVTPSAAIAHLFNVKHYLMLMTIADPESGLPRNVMATWNEREWVITSQNINLTYIAAQKVASRYTAWGTDGTALYPLFQRPSTTLRKRLFTKLYGAPRVQVIKDLTGVYLQAQDKSSDQAGITVAARFDVSGLAVQDAINPSVPNLIDDSSVLLQSPQFQSTAPSWSVWAAGAEGLPFITVGARLDTTSPDFILCNLMLSYVEQTAVGA